MAEATCWTLIEGAAAGDSAARAGFSQRYLPVVRAYLHARWRNRLQGHDLEDAVQEVFVECLRSGGVLERAVDGRRQAFRAFLFGVVRNVALRVESARARRMDLPGGDSFRSETLPLEDESLSRVFDRAWATAIMREAAARQEQVARGAGAEQQKRVELLRLVFEEGRAIADVARTWNVGSDALYHEYSKARAEFLSALKSVVAFHHPDSPEAVARTCRELVSLFG
jgi:DNA-directed RNA polymerase specialized sigma24 family protein